MTELADLEKRLKSNPIYALSLGSRELFHSNFLGWLFEQYPPMIGAIYDGPVSGKVTTERETSNLDLIVEFGEPDERQFLVVEVKVKDAPRLDQLRDYDEKIQKAIKAGTYIGKLHKVLLSLVPAPEQLKCKAESNVDDGWRCVYFASVSRRIMDIASEHPIEPDHKSIIIAYAQLCRDLSDLLDRAIAEDAQEDKYSFLVADKEADIKSVYSVTKNLRFSQTIDKYRASELCEAIKARVAEVKFHEKLEDLELKSGYGLDLKSGYGLDGNRPSAGVSLILNLDQQKFPRSKVDMIDMGVHIQGSQYRRVLSFGRFVVPSREEGKDSAAMEKFIVATDQWNWMFGSQLNGKNLESIGAEGAIPQSGFFKDSLQIPTSQQKNKLLCSYAPKHIYQYTNIGGDGRIPLERLIDAVIADLFYASELLNSEEYVDRFRNWKLNR